LLAGAGSDLGQLTAQAAAAGFRARPLKIEAEFDLETSINRIDSANIVGKIPGTSRPDEAVILLAHWDHLGICRPEGAADRICNGAVDNASGTAILIEVARHLAAGPKPGRTIYILATTAEEGGLMGAEAFASAPPVPRDKIIVALNLDTTAMAPAGLPVAIIGRGNHPELEAVIDDVVRGLGRKVDTDTEANVMITRQDGWAFGARGIPSKMVTGSVSDMKILQDYLAGVYHKPEDDLANLKHLGGAAEDATLHIGLVRALADPARYEAPRR
jgi:Zn-dependent M28 family amino/carboxypeptidase